MHLNKISPRLNENKTCSATEFNSSEPCSKHARKTGAVLSSSQLLSVVLHPPFAKLRVFWFIYAVQAEKVMVSQCGDKINTLKEKLSHTWVRTAIRWRIKPGTSWVQHASMICIQDVFSDFTCQDWKHRTTQLLMSRSRNLCYYFTFSIVSSIRRDEWPANDLAALFRTTQLNPWADYRSGIRK